VTLTADGTYLVNRARQILTLANNAVSDLHREQKLSGTLTIGLGESRLNQFVLQAAQNLVQQYPDVKLQIFSGNAEDIFERLDHGLSDFGVVIDPADKYKYAFTSIPGNNQWGVTLPATDPLAEQPQITAAELQDKPLIISQRQPVRAMLENWAGQPFPDKQFVATYNLIYNANLLVESGLGWAVGINHLITDNHSLKFIPFAPAITSSISLIWLKHAPLSAVGQRFLEILADQKTD
jgi:Transcriptional regulator